MTKEQLMKIFIAYQEIIETGSDSEYYSENAICSDSWEDVSNEIMELHESHVKGEKEIHEKYEQVMNEYKQMVKEYQQILTSKEQQFQKIMGIMNNLIPPPISFYG